MATCFHFRSRFRFRFRFRSRSCFRFRFRFCSRFQKTSHVPRNSKRPKTSPKMPQVPTHIHIHTHTTYRHTQHTDTRHLEAAWEGEDRDSHPLEAARESEYRDSHPLEAAREGENREAQRGVRCTVWVVGWAPARPFQRMSCLQSSKAPLSEGLARKGANKEKCFAQRRRRRRNGRRDASGAQQGGCVPWEGVAVLLSTRPARRRVAAKRHVQCDKRATTQATRQIYSARRRSTMTTTTTTTTTSTTAAAATPARRREWDGEARH